MFCDCHIWSEVMLVQAKDGEGFHGSYEPSQRVTNYQVSNPYQTCFHGTCTQSKILSSVDCLIAHFMIVKLGGDI